MLLNQLIVQNNNKCPPKGNRAQTAAYFVSPTIIKPTAFNYNRKFTTCMHELQVWCIGRGCLVRGCVVDSHHQCPLFNFRFTILLLAWLYWSTILPKHDSYSLQRKSQFRTKLYTLQDYIQGATLCFSTLLFPNLNLKFTVKNYKS